MGLFSNTANVVAQAQDPGPLGPGSLWSETDTNILWRRNDTNTTWIAVNGKTIAASSELLTGVNVNDLIADTTGGMFIINQKADLPDTELQASHGQILLKYWKDDFTSYTTQGTFDTAYPSDDTTNLRGNPTNDNIDFATTHATTTDSTTLSHDIGFTLSNKWVMRLGLQIDQVAQGSNANVVRWFIGMSAVANTTDMDTNQDWIGFGHQGSNTLNEYRIQDTDGASPFDTSADNTFAHTPIAETIFVEIIRESSTVYTAEIFSDSAFSTSVEKETGVCVAGTSGLKFFKIGSHTLSLNADFDFDGVVLASIEIQDGVSEFI